MSEKNNLIKNNVLQSNTEIDYIFLKGNPGFKTYFDLTTQMWSGTYFYFQNSSPRVHKINQSLAYFELFYKSIWWVLIKPIAQIFSTKTTYNGSIYSYSLGGITGYDKTYKVKKTYSFRLFKLPLFGYSTTVLNNADLDIIEEKTEQSK